jgi:hypothetical protein
MISIFSIRPVGILADSGGLMFSLAIPSNNTVNGGFVSFVFRLLLSVQTSSFLLSLKNQTFYRVFSPAGADTLYP